MKKSIIGASLAMAFGLMSGNAFAADNTGTITFNGELTDTTCKVDIEGQGPDATITLPTVSTATLTAAGQVTGRTGFNMNLSDCKVGAAGHSKVSVHSSKLVQPLTKLLAVSKTWMSLQLVQNWFNYNC